MTAYWCELAWMGGPGAEPGVLVEVEEGRITGVTSGIPAPPSGAWRLDGLTLPGLANAHSHAFQRALRGRTQRGSGSFWTWREQMYALAERLDPESYLALARATYAEMALAGVTTVGEFHYLHHGPGGTPYDDPNEMGRALIAAAAEAGIRITLIDSCYLHGGIGEPPEGAQRRFSDGSAEAWVERVDALAESDSARIGAAIHSMRAVDPDAAAVVAGWARSASALCTRTCRSSPPRTRPAWRPTGAPRRRCSPRRVRLRRASPLCTPRISTTDDVRLLGGAGACCCVCPTTERDLADGIGRMRPLRDAGASLSLGSDSHAVIDLFEEARAVELDERLASGERGHHGADALLRAATDGRPRLPGLAGRRADRSPARGRTS